LNKILQFFLELAFPVPCVLCKAPQAAPLCLPCSDALKRDRRCKLCFRPLTSHGCISCSSSFGLDGLKILGLYEEWGEWIRDRKYHPGKSPSIPWWEFLPTEFFNPDTGLVLIPSSRGVHWMENGLPKGLEERSLPALERNPLKLSQKLLNRKERERNGVNLFRIRDDFERRFERVLLVDDVLSTGTSMKTCVTLLRTLGYNQVFGFVLAFQTLKRKGV